MHAFLGASFGELQPGVMLLYGGVTEEGTPLNEAWAFEAQKREWTLVYHADPSLVMPQGALSTIQEGELIALSCSGKPTFQ